MCWKKAEWVFGNPSPNVTIQASCYQVPESDVGCFYFMDQDIQENLRWRYCYINDIKQIIPSFAL